MHFYWLQATYLKVVALWVWLWRLHPLAFYVPKRKHRYFWNNQAYLRLYERGKINYWRSIQGWKLLDTEYYITFHLFFHNITFQEFLFCLWNAFKTTYWWYSETKYLRIFCKKPGSWQQLGEKLGDGTLSPLSLDWDPRSRTSSQPVSPEFHFLICKRRGLYQVTLKVMPDVLSQDFLRRCELKPPLSRWQPGHPRAHCSVCLSSHLRLRDSETQAMAFWVFQEQSQHFLPSFP